MNRSMQLSLRAGEKIFINGAVLRADRRVNLELMNDATFLLEAHVMQASETTSPLRQLYFVVQTILVEPRSAQRATAMFWDMHAQLSELFHNETIRATLARVGDLIRDERAFEALKAIRGLFPTEDVVLGKQDRVVTPAA